MRKLEAKFISNDDGCGNHWFILLKRDGNCCMYERRRMTDDTRHSIEVFITKVVKEGTPLPLGAKVMESYEQYPGKSMFGRTAFSCVTPEHAERRFLELLEKAKSADADISIAPIFEGGVPVTGRSKAQPILPDGEFVIGDAVKLNTGLSQGKIYIYLQQAIRSGTVRDVGVKASSGRGKPSRLYAKVQTIAQ